MKSNFYLKQPKGDKSTPIIYFFSFGGHRLKYYVGRSIHPDFWNAKTQRAKNEGSSTNLANLNILLTNIKNATESKYNELIILKQKPTIGKLKKAIDEVLGKGGEEIRTETLQAYTKEFIKKREANPKYARGSITVYRSTLKQLSIFSPSVQLEDVNANFIEGFVSYLYRQWNPITSNYFTDNYIHKLLSTLKTVLNEAHREGLISHTNYQTRNVVPSRDESTKVYLTKDEIKRIHDLDVYKATAENGRNYSSEEAKQLEIAKDLFVISCVTGLRYSDFSQIREGNIVEEDGTLFIRKKNQKTKQRSSIPLVDIAADIVNNYDRKLPKAASNQRMNDNIKTLARLAGITDKVVISRREGGRDIEREIEKWQVVSSHTGRRSFATNCYLAGVPVPTIKAMGGWKKTETFLKYIRADDLQHAKSAADHSHFKHY